MIVEMESRCGCNVLKESDERQRTIDEIGLTDSVSR